MNYFKLSFKARTNVLLFFVIITNPIPTKKKLSEGMIESTFEWQSNKTDWKWSYFMPEKEIIYFKGKKIRKDSYCRNNITLSYLYDEDKHEQYLLMNANGENIAYKNGGPMLSIFKAYSNCSMKVTKEKKKIQGYNCYKVKMLLNNKPDALKTELWFTNEIDIPVFPESQPMDISDYMIEASICDSINNCFHKLSKKIKKITVPDSSFELPPNVIIKSSQDLAPIK